MTFEIGPRSNRYSPGSGLINYISADSGGISLMLASGPRGYVGRASEVGSLARLMARFGLAERVMHSSTMDFASEEGFENDDAAWALWDAAVEEYNWLESPNPGDPIHW